MKKTIKRFIAILLSFWMLLSPFAQVYAESPESFVLPAESRIQNAVSFATASEADVPASDTDVPAAEAEKSSSSDAQKKTGLRQLSARAGSTRIVMTFDADAFEETEGLRLSAWEIRNEKTVGQYVDVIENDREVEDLLRETHTEAAEDEVPLVNDIVLYDIRVYNAEGEELQPLKEVSVTFENIEEAVETEEENPSGLQVCHFEDRTTMEVLEAENKADGSLQVVTEHFSVYAVTSMNMGYHLGSVEDPEWCPDVCEPKLYRITSDEEGNTLELSDTSPSFSSSAVQTVGSGDLPSSYSTVEEYGLPEARNQGSHGLCWSFSAICLAESYQRRFNRADITVDYSEMAQAYFAFHHPADPLGLTTGDSMMINPYETGTFLDYGGNCYMAAENLSGWVGVTEEEDAPYSDTTPDPSVAYEDSVILKDSYFFNDDDQTSVKNHIMEYGAVSVAYYHNNSYLHRNLDTGKTYYYYSGTKDPSHNVTIVGWDDNVSRANFSENPEKRPGGSGAWLARNSWGTTWGDDGYFWISYQDASLTMFNGMVFTDTDTWDHNYHYDGSAYPASYYSSDYSVGNIFHTTGVPQTLDAVSLATYTDDTDYTLKIYRKNTGTMYSPASGTLVYSDTGTMEYAGINTVGLSTPVELSANQYFSVIFELTGNVEIGISANVSASDETFWSVDMSGERQSFRKTGSSWTDLKGSQYSARIHAYTKEIAEEEYSVSYVLNGGENNSANPSCYTESSGHITLADPVRTGYTFAGWYSDEALEVPSDTIPAGSTGDRTFYAKWTVNRYTISFNTHGGSPVASVTQDYGTEVATPSEPVKTGYTFAGWNPEVPAGMPAENIVIEAVWTPDTDTAYTVIHRKQNISGTGYTTEETENLYGTTDASVTPVVRQYDGFTAPETQTVTIAPDGTASVVYLYTRNSYHIRFDMNGYGSPVSDIVSRHGAAVCAPSGPRSAGCSFGGWYTEKTCVHPYSFSVMPVGGMTVYARWIPNRYTITFDSDGGSVIPSITQDYDTAVAEPEEPKKTGYTFIGWTPGLPEKVPAENLMLKAVWTPVVYTVRFSGNGAASGTMASVRRKYGDRKALPANIFKKTGYTFAGWNTKADGSGTAIANKSSSSLKKTAGTITLYAQWKKTKYTISYMLAGGKNSSSNPAAYYITSSTITLKSPARTGYTFAGWYSDAKYKTRVTKIGKGSTGNKTLYAKWTAVPYTVRFSGNGAASGTMVSVTRKYGDRKALPANIFKKTGYTFAGWNTKADGSGTAIANKSSSSLKKTAGTITLYAQWKKTKYTITYQLAGGKNSSSNPAAYYITSSTITLKNPSRAGYTFLGWYSDAKYKTRVTSIKKGSIGNRTLYARWKKK